MEPSPNISCYRLYRGVGSAAAIDYSTAIATVDPPDPPGEPVRVQIPPIAGGWTPGVTWFIAVRAVDGDGFEFADPAAIIQAEFDDDGRLLPPSPRPVSDIAARRISGQRLRISWRHGDDDCSPWPALFEVFLAPWDGTTTQQMLAGAPAATVPSGGQRSHSYAWTSGPLSPGRWRVAIRGVAESGAAGPTRAAVASVTAPKALPVLSLIAEVR